MQRLLTVDEAADVLRQSKYTIRNWIKRGRLPANKVGHKWLIVESTIQDMVEPAPKGMKKVTREESRRRMYELIEETRAAGITEDTYDRAMARRDAIYEASREETKRMIDGRSS